MVPGQKGDYSGNLLKSQFDSYKLSFIYMKLRPVDWGGYGGHITVKFCSKFAPTIIKTVELILLFLLVQ